MFVYNHIFFSIPRTFTAPSIVCVRGMFIHLGGGPEFFHEAKGWTKIFPRTQRVGDQNFFTYAKGGPEKIGDRLSQTDGPPPGKKW